MVDRWTATNRLCRSGLCQDKGSHPIGVAYLSEGCKADNLQGGGASFNFEQFISAGPSEHQLFLFYGLSFGSFVSSRLELKFIFLSSNIT